MSILRLWVSCATDRNVHPTLCSLCSIQRVLVNRLLLLATEQIATKQSFVTLLTKPKQKRDNDCSEYATATLKAESKNGDRGNDENFRKLKPL